MRNCAESSTRNGGGPTMPKPPEPVPQIFFNFQQSQPIINQISMRLVEKGCRVLRNDKIPPHIAEVGEECGIFIILPNFHLENISPTYEAIDEFLTDYPDGQIVCHTYPRDTLDISAIGLFMKIFIEFGTGVIPTINSDHTAYCIKSLAKRIQIKDKPPTMGRIKPKFKTIKDAQIYFVQGLYDCGPKKAEKLMKNYASIEDILHSFTAKPEEFLMGTTKSISRIKDFGPIFEKKNKKLLQEQPS